MASGREISSNFTSATEAAATSSEVTNVINFYGLKNPWNEFSNFYGCEIVIDGIKWPTTEVRHTTDLNLQHSLFVVHIGQGLVTKFRTELNIA